jgi:pimeloyl-ACP methyl ester carboxylesterase
MVPRPPPRLALLAAAVAVCLGASCSGGGDGARGPRLERGSIDWEDCGGIDCATLEVPLDHDDPDAGTIELALGRRRATGDDVIGALLFNPGGPGAPAVELLDRADALFTGTVLERFDVVTWDPRGVGESTPVDCVDDLDRFFAVDRSPDDAGEVEANLAEARRLAAGCGRRSGELLAHLSSRSTVRDMELIREALGEPRLTYVGFSYGSYLGALYADAHPRRVRALVLDGAVDPARSYEQTALDQAKGFDGALAAFFAHCERVDCGFGGSDPRAAYEDLMSQIDAETLPAVVAGERRLVGPGEADIGVATALYAGEEGWDLLARALTSAARGDGSILASLADTYTGRLPGGEYDNDTEAFYATGCLDGAAPPPGELAPMAQRIAAEAPYFGAATLWLGAPCSVWPVPPDGSPAPVRAAGAPPIVVLGTTNDPATPLAWAEALAAQLESARLVVYDGEGHLAYARGDECVDRAVDAYLVDLEPPPAGLRCPAR